MSELAKSFDPHAIEAHYTMLEKSLGKQKLLQVYALLDELIALEGP